MPINHKPDCQCAVCKNRRKKEAEGAVPEESIVPSVRPMKQQVVLTSSIHGIPETIFTTIEGYNARTGQYKVVHRKKFFWVNAENIKTR